MDLKEINLRISDRSNCFYWQTDRKISAEEAAMIWKDRHSAITNEELLDKINSELKDDKLLYIKPFDETAQTSLGNVNSIRVGVLESGKEVIIRCHPKGVLNGYFYAESLASSIALENGIPAYKTYCIHELENEEDISYQVIEKLDGDTVQFCLKGDPEKENRLVFEMGKTMSQLHKIKVNGFGPFDNEQAKKGILKGIHSSLKDSVNAGLEENLERLVNYNIITREIADKMKALFDNSELFNSDVSVLIHNDFADWNLLSDGHRITGVIDWDECVAGHPIQEIACWSTFFDPERIKPFLKGYFSETPLYDNFDELFQLMRLRYTISKMALRTKRYTYEQTPFLKSMIEKGQKHLAELSEIFSLTEQKNDKLLIMAYMGTGKTEIENRYDNVVDFDFQDYKYIYDESIRHLPLEQRKGSVSLRTENSDYPSNFIDDALLHLNSGKIVISPFIDHVFRAYDSEGFKSRANGVRVILVFPERDNFLEYVERFKSRGNSDEFIARRENEFDSLADLFEEAEGYEKIIIKPGQFLSDALIEYGIDLQVNNNNVKKKI